MMIFFEILFVVAAVVASVWFSRILNKLPQDLAQAGVARRQPNDE